MQALSIARIGSDKRGTARIWLEGRRLERAGFVPAARSEIALVETTRTITLRLAANGKRMVSRTVRGDTDLPVLHIVHGTLLDSFAGLEKFKISSEETAVVRSAKHQV